MVKIALESNFNSLTLPQLLSIKKTLTLPDEDLAIWIKVEDLDKDNLPVGTYIGINGEFYVGYIELEGEEVSLVYNNGESIMYPTHIISTLALLHIPNHPLPPQKTLTQKEEDVVELWCVKKDREELLEFANDPDTMEIDTVLGVNGSSGMVGKIILHKNSIWIEGEDDIFKPTHIIPLSQLLKLPTKPSTK
jgi:hypothetical protein